jgi:hypothetical protein
VKGRRQMRPPLQKKAIMVHLFVILCLVTAWSIPSIAEAGAKPATKIYNVADTRGLEPGLTKWIGDIYNGNPWIYALLVVGIMSGMGLILGYAMDRLLKLLGINLGRLQHHE